MNINLSLTYITKYNPNINFISNNQINKKLFLKKYIHSYLILQNLFNFKRTSLKINKIKKNWYTFLKSPNRHKKHQAHIYQEFYLIKINLNLVYNLTNIERINFLELIKILLNLFLYESNLYTLKALKSKIKICHNFNK